MERLTGDPHGIAALKRLSETHRQFLKHLITEARSNLDHCARFQDEDGTRYTLRLNLQTGQLQVQATH